MIDIGQTNALVIASLITQAGGFVAVWFKARSAERLSKPTSNGFASDVKNALRRIESKVDSHLTDHARGDIDGRRKR